jgi:hypothetical protein
MSEQLRTAEPVRASTTAHAPEFFRLPARGLDPHFGLSRTYYYSLERDGLIRMVRLRRPGTIRGTLLVPYAAVKALINEAAQRTN